MAKTISHKDAMTASLEYFGGNELAASAFVGKYALRDKSGTLLETTPDDMHKRLATEFARIESNYPNPLSCDEIYDYLHKFTKIIPQGSPMMGIGNPYKVVSIGNCFVVPNVFDSVSGISYTDQQLANLFKRRCGVGVDVSGLRPKDMLVANAAGSTTGIATFMEKFSETCRGIGQAGRRGALMISISCHHPEIRTFINIKKDLQKITGANISIRWTDEFLTAVKNNTDVQLRWPVESKTPSISEMVNAKLVWDEFVDAAWTSAEPGCLFWDTVLNNSPSDAYASLGFATICCNPCSEIAMSPDSCRLLLVNAMGFVNAPFRSRSKFDWKKFERACYVGQRLMDDIVDLELECIEKILAKVKSDPEPDYIKQSELDMWEMFKKSAIAGRRTGLGLTAIGDVLASLGMRYGSEDSIKFVEQLYQTMELQSWSSSIDMAAERGAFPIWNADLEKDNPMIQRVLDIDPELREKYNQHGRRNIANTTTPPAGTTSLLACLSEKHNMFGTTSGIEPVFKVEYKRRKKINPNDTDARVDFVDALGDKWQEYVVNHAGYDLWQKEHGDQQITLGLYFDPKPENSPYWKSTSADVDWMASVDIQAAAQKWVDHAISKTCNLPKDATREVVNDVYLRAWESGCKGFTIYRDECRSGVLVSNDVPTTKSETILQTNAPKRPKELLCDIYHSTVLGEKWALFVGMMDGKPYEIMGGLAKFVKIPRRVVKGKLLKFNGDINPARYDLVYDHDKGADEETVISDVGNIFENPTHSGYTRMISLSLRHGAGVQYVVEQLTKAGEKESDLFSISKAFSRVLKNYIPDGTVITSVKKCKHCGSKELAYKDGCVQCMGCGDSKCS